MNLKVCTEDVHGTRFRGICGTHDRRNEAVLAYVKLQKCARQESNLRPLAPEASALSPELRARALSVSQNNKKAPVTEGPPRSDLGQTWWLRRTSEGGKARSRGLFLFRQL